MRAFQNYHRHSHYTNARVPDSVITNEDYAKRAIELGHGIISSCEHGFQGRHIEGFNLGKKYGLKFLMSAEAYWVKDRHEKDGTNCHMFIGARNENGRQCLNEILSVANEDGFYGRPRIDEELIMSLPPEDVIITTACVAGWKYDDVETFYKELNDRFKYFFLEVQYHNTESQRELNRRILRLHNEWKTPLIMGCDSHYIFENEKIDRADFLISKDFNYPDEEGWYMDYPDGDTAYERFAEQCVLKHSDIIDAIDNTNIFLDIEEYDSPVYDDEIKMPTIYPDLTQAQKDAIYDDIIWSSWDRYKKRVPEEKHAHYVDEIKSEVQTVHDTFTSDYFLINHKVIQRGIENGGYLTRSGRGSAVSYATNMLLGFTDVDRISASVKMFPDRFMSTSRILQSRSLPDIDFNVADPEPFALAQKQILGDDHAYPMVAYGTMKKSSAWKMYAKSQEVDFEIANEISQQIKKYENALKHAEEDERDDINVHDYIDEQYHEIFDKSIGYQGIVVSWSIAPCSYLLYSGSIRREVGLVRVSDKMCCLMDGKWAEEGHFLKNDLLKVRVVDLIYRTYERIGRKPHTVNELLALCPPEDPVWDIYKKQCLLGINQVEQPGTSSRVAKYAPTNISELCAFVAAIRPGFKSMYKTFESREPFSYNVPSFDNLIKTEEMPHSFLFYQEHVMAAMNYAGIDISEAYTCIKAIAKKRVEKVLSYKTQFIEGFSKRLIDGEHVSEAEASETSHRVWQILEDSSAYSFNASHSYCVALDSLYGAYLKCHYPLEYYESYLRIQDEKKNKQKLTDGREEAENYFKIKFPRMMFGQDNRLITANKDEFAINNSLSSIKGFGTKIGEELYQLSQLGQISFVRLLSELAQRSIKESVTLPLAKIGYFSEFGKDRAIFFLIEKMAKCDYCRAASYARNDVEHDANLAMIIEKYCNGLTKQGTPAARYTVIYDGINELATEKRQINKMLKTLNPDTEIDEVNRLRERLLEIESLVRERLYDQNLRMWEEYEKIILSIPCADLDFKTRIQNQMDVLGTVDFTTNKAEDRGKLIILKVTPLGTESIWGYAVNTKSIGSGKLGRWTIPSWLFKKNPIEEKDVIFVRIEDVHKNKKGYWYINEYHKIYS